MIHSQLCSTKVGPGVNIAHDGVGACQASIKNPVHAVSRCAQTAGRPALMGVDVMAGQFSKAARICAVITAGCSSTTKWTDRSRPCGPVMSTLKPPRNGSEAIHASCGAGRSLPAAATAISMHSRRSAGMPFTSKTVIGTESFYCGDPPPARLHRMVAVEAVVEGELLDDRSARLNGR